MPSHVQNFTRWRWVGALALLVVVGAGADAWAQVQCNGLFRSHMVLKARADVPVWGSANANDKITVVLKEQGSNKALQTKTGTANDKGQWKINLDPVNNTKAKYELTVAGGDKTLSFTDVLFGQVWLCSGQSNMGMTVSRSLNFDKEKANANHSNLRMFTVARATSQKPLENVKGDWKICTPENVGAFSATAYFFGREILKETGEPVGLINSSWGGTAVEAWTSMPTNNANNQIKPLLDSWAQKAKNFDQASADKRYAQQLDNWRKRAAQAKENGKKPPRKPRKPGNPATNQNYPSNLFNAMINPLVPYALNGAIWYQGERNSRYMSELYGNMLSRMIVNWRELWKSEFPFYIVQLPDFQSAQKAPVEDNGWVAVREGMLNVSKSVPKTGIAVTLGLGEANDIHPKNKQGVGYRLSRLALSKEGFARTGPTFEKMTVADGSATLTFGDVGNGLQAKDGKLQGFAVAGPDKQWVWADAKVAGKNQVVVSSPKVKEPWAVRYAWASNPKFSLFNSNPSGELDLPASPFRTDSEKFKLGQKLP